MKIIFDLKDGPYEIYKDMTITLSTFKADTDISISLNQPRPIIELTGYITSATKQVLKNPMNCGKVE